MPNGPQDALALQAVSGKLKARRDRIASLPVEQQLRVYGVAFDRYVRPTLSRSGIKKDEDLDVAKDRWITGLVAPGKQEQLPSGFGVDETPRSTLTEASAAFTGLLAGTAGGAKNILDFFDSSLAPRLPDAGFPVLPGVMQGHDWLRGQFGEAEQVEYELAKTGSEPHAKAGAAIGHQIPSLLMYEAASGAIPSFAKGTPTAWRLLSRLGKAAVGGAAGSIPYGEKDPKQLAESAAVNVAIDSILGGVGKVSSTGARRIISKLTTSSSATHKAAAAAVDDLLGTMLQAKFPGRKVDDLSSAEFDSLVKEAQAARAEAQAKAKSAAKAVKDAEKAARPTPEQQALAKAKDKEVKIAERKLKAEKSKFMAKQLSEYKKRIGSLPGEASEHFKRISAGESVEKILGPAPEQAAKQAEETTKSQILAEGAPQAVDAVKTFQAAGGLTSMASAEKAELEKLAGKPLTEEEAVAFRKNRLEWESVKSLAAGKSDVAAKETAGLKDRPRSGVSKAKREPFFKTDTSRIIGAKTPEEFAKAKKEAKDEVVRQAREKAKNIGSAAEGIKISEEARKEHRRIDSITTPSEFSIKTKDAARKQAEAVGTAGSVPIEEAAKLTGEAGSRPATFGDPEVLMIQQDQLLEQLSELTSPEQVNRIKAAIKGKDLGIQNEMLMAALKQIQRIKAIEKIGR